MPDTLRPSRRQRLTGLGLLLFGLGMTAWGWYTAKPETLSDLDQIVKSPAYAVGGLALMRYPTSKDERLARGEEVSDRDRDTLTPRWLAIVFIATLVGFGNWLLMWVYVK